MDIQPVDDKTIAVTTDVPATTQTTNYNIDELVAQQSFLTGLIQVKQAELDNINNLIAQASQLGIQPTQIVDNRTPEELAQ